MALVLTISVALLSIQSVLSNVVLEIPGEKKLREDLLRLYDWPVRPVKNYSDRLWVYVRFRLTSIVGLDLKDQVLALNVKIDQEWTDYKFKWDPNSYGGVDHIILPARSVWRPDLEHYYKFGDFYMHEGGTFVRVHHDGQILWTTGRVIRSFCLIEVRYYPFDIQTCYLKFGSWTYDGNLLFPTLKELTKENPNGSGYLPVGMDLSEYYPSSEWDLISIPATCSVNYYVCCPEPYVSIDFNVTLRRHTHFYSMNLVLPLTGISYLSLLVFYLPADSGEKVTLSVSLLTCQVMFLLLMMDNLPVTSLAVPLLGKLIVFNMILVFLSVICTTLVLNVHYRKPTTHKTPKWITRLRYSFVPKLLFIEVVAGKRPEESVHNESSTEKHSSDYNTDPESRLKNVTRLCGMSLQEIDALIPGSTYDRQESSSGKHGFTCQVKNALANVTFVRNYMANLQQASNECEDWKFLASILDRIFFIVFNIVFIVGSVTIMKDAPALYDQRPALNGNAAITESERDVQTFLKLVNLSSTNESTETGFTYDVTVENNQVLFEE